MQYLARIIQIKIYYYKLGYLNWYWYYFFKIGAKSVIESYTIYFISKIIEVVYIGLKMHRLHE